MNQIVNEQFIADSVARSLDACTPKLAVPEMPQIDLEASVIRTVEDAVGSVTGLGNEYIFQLKSELNLLELNLATIADLSGLAKIKLPSIQSINVGKIVEGIAGQVANLAKKTAVDLLTRELNKITTLTALELSRNAEPVLSALRQVNTVLGGVAAQKMLVDAALSTQDCPAKAELLAEIYFRMKR